MNVYASSLALPLHQKTEDRGATKVSAFKPKPSLWVRVPLTILGAAALLGIFWFVTAVAFSLPVQ